MFSQAYQTAVKNGKAFSWSNLTYNPAALDTVLMVCNDHATLKLYIERVDFSADTATQYVIHTPSYATWAGTEVVGVCLDGSGNTAVATAKANETGQGTRGAAIGGGSVLASGESKNWISYELGYHKAIGVDVVADVGGSLVTIYGYFG